MTTDTGTSTLLLELQRERAREKGSQPHRKGIPLEVSRLAEAIHPLAVDHIAMAPTNIEDPDSVGSIFEFIQQGGRLPAVNYNQTSVMGEQTLTEEEKAEGFRLAREFLSRPMYSRVDGQELKQGNQFNPSTYRPRNPNKQEETFGEVHGLHVDMVDQVMETVDTRHEEYIEGWDGSENLQNRIAVTDRAMASAFKDKHVLAGILALAGGKSGLEVWRDMQELLDFVQNYRLVDHAIALEQMTLRSKGDTSIGFRPFDKPIGVWQPFNFPCIGIGEIIAALIMGNTAVVHTSARMVGAYMWFYEKLIEAGVPPGRLHFIIPDGDPDDVSGIDPEMSKKLAADPRLGNIYFTGSYGVASQLLETQQQKAAALGRLDIKLHAESGGYNTMLISGFPEGVMAALEDLFALHQGSPSDSDWDKFFNDLPDHPFLNSFKEALGDSACGLQAHKCSSLHEVIIAKGTDGALQGDDGVLPRHVTMIEQFIVQVMNRVEPGNVTEVPDAYYGGLIDQAAHKDVQTKVAEILKRGGRILTGDGSLYERMSVKHLPGTGMRPIVYRDDNRETGTGADVEIFAPVFRINVVEGKDAAIARAQEIDYALTGAAIAPTIDEALDIRDQMPAGVVYVNDDEYFPTTTAAPAPAVPFGGKKASGTDSGTLKPGTWKHPLQFAEAYSRSIPRGEWGQGRGHDPQMEAYQALLAIQGVQLDTQGLAQELILKRLEAKKD